MALTMRTVEDDIFNFLKYATFGIVKDELTTASRFAYRDMNRTLWFHGLADDKRLLLREEVLHLLKSRIPDLLNGNIENQEQFDSWHRLLG